MRVANRDPVRLLVVVFCSLQVRMDSHNRALRLHVESGMRLYSQQRCYRERAPFLRCQAEPAEGECQMAAHEYEGCARTSACLLELAFTFGRLSACRSSTSWRKLDV